MLYAYLAEVNDNKHRSMAIMMNGMAFAFAQILQPGQHAVRDSSAGLHPSLFQ